MGVSRRLAALAAALAAMGCRLPPAAVHAAEVHRYGTQTNCSQAEYSYGTRCIW